MQATFVLLLTPTSIERRSNLSSSINRRINRRISVVSSAIIQNHYVVLGVPVTASFAHIKKAYRLLALKVSATASFPLINIAYRLLALKYHPDVSKDSRSDDIFKSIRLAYDVLSDETTRNQYDRALKFQTDTVKPLQENWDFTEEIDDEVRLYEWSDRKRRMRYERHREKFSSRYDNIHSDEDTENKSEEESDLGKERESLVGVIKSTFLALLLLQIGARVSLTFSALMALFDRKLDTGYKVGYMIAWVFGGEGGVLLSLCLSFASWICGKTSSSLVTLVVLAVWVGSNIARYAPLPQGALLALLYMSIKLQSDLN